MTATEPVDGMWPAGAAGRRRAMTLVELLVVAAVLVVLASLILPALKSALETSRRARCASNEHQMYAAFCVYAEDHAGFMPASEFTNDTFNGATRPRTDANRMWPASPMRIWLADYAGVKGPWENWTPSAGGRVNDADPMTEPAGTYGPYPKTRNHIVYCPSFPVYAIQYPLGEGINTRRYNAVLHYALQGLGVFHKGWTGDTYNPLRFVGTASLERLAAGAGGRRFLLLSDITTDWSLNQSWKEFNFQNHNRRGGNFTDAGGATRWHDMEPKVYPGGGIAAAPPWLDSSDSTGHKNYGEGYAIQEWKPRTGVREMHILVDGVEQNMSSDDCLSLLGYRR